MAGFGAAQVWATEPGPVSNEGRPTRPRRTPRSRCTRSSAAPSSGWRTSHPTAPTTRRGKGALFADIGGDEARDGATHSGDRHFWFHKTDSIDFAVVLEGEIWLLLDEDECLLEAGDVIVQRGTAHSWSNRSGKPCRMAFLLLGALPVPAAEAAEEEQLAGRQT